MLTSTAVPSSLICCCSTTTPHSRKKKNLSHFVEVVKKNSNYLKTWTSKTIPQLAKKVDQLVWLRNLEDPNYQEPCWPHPSQCHYPELSGTELMLADIKALEAYIRYYYYMSKKWSKPLPEVYDAQEADEYFKCRPHVVALRLIEVFGSFASAAIRIRLAGSGSSEIDEYNFGLVLKETMLNLGPTFIKVGQSLSTRPDIIGNQISKALSELHDQIPPFPRALAMKIIEEELGSPVETFYSYISEESIAAASFGQVYRAKTVDGHDVAVKVQRPNLRHVVFRDVHIMRVGLDIYQQVAKRKNDLRLYADELGKGLVGELDYTLEAANAVEFMEAHSSFPCIRVPKVYQHLTQKRVLTMEWMAGENPKDLISKCSSNNFEQEAQYSEKQRVEAKRQLLDLVNKGVEACLVQLIETGLLHADPHPGNMLYLPSGQIGFLDFGLICRMEKKHKFAMLGAIIHIVNGDWASLVGSLADMDVVKPGTNLSRVTMELENAMGEVEFKDGIADVRFSKVLGKVWEIAFKYNFRMPPYFTLLLRSLASFEGLAMAGDSNFNTFEDSYPYVVRKLLTDNSLDTRKILHAVALNKRKELQWNKVAFFLRVGATSKGLQLASKSRTSAEEPSNNVSDTVNLALKLLLSKDGVVVRRLVMTADGASIIRDIVSKEASPYRHQVCKIIADMIYQSICAALGKAFLVARYGAIYTSSTTSAFNYQSLVKDRRLKVIFLSVLESGRKIPALMARLCWVSFLTLVAASALACHRLLVSLSAAHLGRLSFTPKKVAVRC